MISKAIRMTREDVEKVTDASDIINNRDEHDEETVKEAIGDLIDFSLKYEDELNHIDIFMNLSKDGEIPPMSELVSALGREDVIDKFYNIIQDMDGPVLPMISAIEQESLADKLQEFGYSIEEIQDMNDEELQALAEDLAKQHALKHLSQLKEKTLYDDKEAFSYFQYAMSTVIDVLRLNQFIRFGIKTSSADIIDSLSLHLMHEMSSVEEAHCFYSGDNEISPEEISGSVEIVEKIESKIKSLIEEKYPDIPKDGLAIALLNIASDYISTNNLIDMDRSPIDYINTELHKDIAEILDIDTDWYRDQAGDIVRRLSDLKDNVNASNSDECKKELEELEDEFEGLTDKFFDNIPDEYYHKHRSYKRNNMDTETVEEGLEVLNAIKGKGNKPKKTSTNTKKSSTNAKKSSTNAKKEVKKKKPTDKEMRNLLKS